MRISFVDGTVRGKDCDCNAVSPHACSGAPLVHYTGVVQPQYKYDCCWCDCACHNGSWTKPQNMMLADWLRSIEDETFAGDPGAQPEWTLTDQEMQSFAALDRELAQEQLDKVQDMRAGFLGRNAYHHHTERVQDAPERTSVDISSVMLTYLMG